MASIEIAPKESLQEQKARLETQLSPERRLLLERIRSVRVKVRFNTGEAMHEWDEQDGISNDD